MNHPNPKTEATRLAALRAWRRKGARSPIRSK